MALRLTVQDLNLNQIYDGLQPVDKLPEIGPTGRLFANLMPMAADVAFIAQRFRLAGENGRRLRGKRALARKALFLNGLAPICHSARNCWHRAR